MPDGHPVSSKVHETFSVDLQAMLFVFLPIFCIIVIFRYKSNLPMRNGVSTNLPPLVPGWPLIGNSLELAAEPVQFWIDAAKKYGPAYRVRYPTAPNGEMTVLAGLEANRLASRQGHLFSNRQYFDRLADEAGTANYMCALDGEEHAHFRKVMKPALSRESLAPIVPELIRMVEQQTSRWTPGEIFSVSERLQRITVDGLAYAAGGAGIGESEYQHLCKFSKFFIGAGAAGWPRFLLKMPFYKRAKDAVHSYLKQMLRDHARRRPGTERRADTIDLVLNAAYRDGRPFSEADQLANAHLPYANGITYTGRVGAFLIYELLQKPEILARLRAEIDAAYSDGTPTMRELRSMTLLRNCVREIIRYRPIAPAVPRFARETFEFEGYSVPAGSFVFLQSAFLTSIRITLRIRISSIRIVIRRREARRCVRTHTLLSVSERTPVSASD
jgi:cytochrome P450